MLRLRGLLLQIKLFPTSIISLAAILTVGCGGGSAGTSNLATIQIAPTGENLTYAKVASSAPGSVYYVILDRPGGRIIRPVQYSGSSNDASGKVFWFTIQGQPVGEGDSGSLVMDSKGNTVGALAFGFGGNYTNFGVTSIEDELSILNSGPSTTRNTAKKFTAQKDGLAHIMRGVSPYLWGIMSKDTRNPISKIFTLESSPAPKSASKSAPKAADLSGTMFSKTVFMLSSYGDAVSAYTYGTVTVPAQGKYLCFGHPLNWEGGGQDIPCVLGTVTNFIIDPAGGNFKLGFPDVTKSVGTLVADRRFGVVVDPSVTATPIPVDGTVTLNANSPVTFHGKVARDPSLETSMVLTNVVQGTANIIDAVDIAGSSTGSATLTFDDGSTQNVDLADSSSSYLLSDLYNSVGSVLFSSSGGIPPRITSITFNIQITTN